MLWRRLRDLKYRFARDSIALRYGPRPCLPVVLNRSGAIFRPRLQPGRARHAWIERPCGLSDRGGYLAERSAASMRSEEHTSELQSLMRISYAVFCLTQKNKKTKQRHERT